ncbi:MAG: sulfatase [Gemmatimonadota bacterium]|nr:MAG: sulfatase [Gemmatimonadota bacterium]
MTGATQTALRHEFSSVVAVLVSSVACLLTGCAGLEPPPNVVVILIDDLGWRDLGVMGSAYYETPNIDRLAQQGMLFTQAYANAPNCAPSRASLLSGQYPPRHGVYTVGSSARGDRRDRRLIPVENQTALGPEVITIAEALRAVGYVTGYFGKWHLGGEGSLPVDQGFLVNVAGNELGSPPSYFYPYEGPRGQLLDLAQGGYEGEYLTDRLTDEALRFLEANSEQPFFLFLSHYAVHTPIRAKQEIIDRFRDREGIGGHDNPIYAAMIYSVDESVGRVMSKLEELGLQDNTAVFFFSDNGGFGPVTSMAPLRGSKGMLYEGGIREPLIVRWPRMIVAGATTREPVIGTDLYPTILEIAEAASADGHVLDGVSLMPLLTGTGGLTERSLFWHFPAYLEADRSVSGPWRTTPAGAIRRGNFKLLQFFEDGRLELYDVERDPGEQQNLAASLPDTTEHLLELLEQWRVATDAPVPTVPNPEFRRTAGRDR